MKYKIVEKQDAVKSTVPKEPIKSIPLNKDQQQNWLMYGSLNKPEIKQTYISQGKKLNPAEQKASDIKLTSAEKFENYNKQQEKEKQQLQKAIEVAPYLIPGIGQAMWAGKAVDLATNKLSNNKYQSWGDMVDKNVGGSHTGVDKFVADLTNPGYYAGTVAKVAQPLIKKSVQNSGKYLLSKTEPYLLREKKIPMTGYKPKQEFWNPFKKENKFIPNSESYYRIIGDESGYNDLINSGIVRPNQNGIFSGRSTYYTKGAINDINNPVIGGGVKKGTAYKGDYIVEINKNNTHFPTQEHGLNKDWNFGITKPGDEIPYSSDYLNVYKRSGKNYIKLEKQQVPFKSEINWGNWNKEIPSNKHLMDEYLQIEKSTKQNGTWMKNPNGSNFEGTPEQFVQQNSNNFKKAFSEGHDITYRGDRTHYPELDYNPIFTGDKKMALNYTNENAGYWTSNSPAGSVSDIRNPSAGGLHELYYNPKRITLKIDAKNKDYIGEFLDNQTGVKYGSTDDIARAIASGSRDAEFKNIYDGSTHAGTVRIINHNFGSNNFMKSARGNNGMFDMTNPNIYKGLVPAAGLYGLTQSKKQGGILKKKYI